MAQEIKRLAIIGAGPKAAAIAAKAEVLNRDKNRNARIEITIFEKTGIGANWDGRHGYTDGEQLLCTASVRDLGFPYLSPFPDVDSALHDSYSWARFNIDHIPGYTTWVDHARTCAPHKEFARYLRWAIKKSGATYVQREVLQLIPDKKEGERHNSQWQIITAKPHLKHPSSARFDGVVITGPGPANSVTLENLGKDANRVFTGEDFWVRRKEIEKLVRKSLGKEIVVIGGGGTAAAIVAWLVKNGHAKTRIYIVSNQATIYTRIDSSFENKVFSDVSLWSKISPANRLAFFNRVNRGVVWSSVINVINDGEFIVPTDGRAKCVVPHPDTVLEVRVQLWDEKELRLGASVVIDASGFDAWWFRKLLHETHAEETWKSSWKQALTSEMSENLNFVKPHWMNPPLHAPMLSSYVGPGYASLMVMGNFSDAILTGYLRTGASTIEKAIEP